MTKQKPDIDLTDRDPDRTVSRRHARLSMIDGEVFLSEEVAVTNGTFVNDQQVDKGKMKQVFDGDTIRFGAVEFILTLQKPA